jgi:2-methylcitrate dehydratase PrpD
MKTVLNPQGPTMVKNNFGFAAASGIIAALLAKEGFTGPRNILDGDTGFWRMYGSDRCNFRKMTEGLGSSYEILNVGFKPYSTCRWIHPAIDASLNIVKMYKINVEDIKEIRVRTLSIITKPPYDNYVPKNMLEAQFSTPFSIAVALYGVEPGPKWFTKATLTNPHILKLAKKVKLIPDKEADRLYPEKMLATVEIDTKLGQYTYKVDTPKGDPSNPMSYEELEDKFKKLASTIIAIDKVKRIVQLVRDLEKIDDIRNIIAMLSQ